MHSYVENVLAKSHANGPETEKDIDIKPQLPTTFSTEALVNLVDVQYWPSRGEEKK